MATIVTDAGFSEDDWKGEFHDWLKLDVMTLGIKPGLALDVPNSIAGDELVATFDQVELVRIPFPSHVDGRGFTLARRLRRLGYRGRLRAKGHILSDQYAMARRCGFDEIEIEDVLAQRQPPDQWKTGMEWRQESYQSRLKGLAR